MLKSLYLKNFTVFSEANLEFGKNLNIIVGENGLGKTHILKVVYCVLEVTTQRNKDFFTANPTKSLLQKAIAKKLRGVFRSDGVGRLARRQIGRGRSEVECHFEQSQFDLKFSIGTSSKSEVNINKAPSAWGEDVPVYLPTRELLTIYPGFVSLYETTHLPFEETWKDTAILLGAPLLKGISEQKIRQLLQPLETAMNGTVELEGDRFYLETEVGRFEMHLVAEGFRKLAMIARLIATGSLSERGYLFWDEPEANLNPKLIKLIARTILNISQSGIQVFIATHSLFLLRELYILQQEEFTGLNVRCFGLHLGPDDGAVSIEQGETMDDIGDISALDEELAQSERYIDTDNKVTEAKAQD